MAEDALDEPLLPALVTVVQERGPDEAQEDGRFGADEIQPEAGLERESGRGGRRREQAYHDQCDLPDLPGYGNDDPREEG